MVQGGAIKPPTKNKMSREWPPAAASDGGANAFRQCSHAAAEHVDAISCHVGMKRKPKA